MYPLVLVLIRFENLDSPVKFLFFMVIFHLLLYEDPTQIIFKPEFIWNQFQTHYLHFLLGFLWFF
ncbi:MAG: hypothetical protein ACXACR_13770, partial [Candidatus Hodarchaeales archaeon]